MNSTGTKHGQGAPAADPVGRRLHEAQEEAKKLAAFIVWRTEGNDTIAAALVRLVNLVAAEDSTTRECIVLGAEQGAFGMSGAGYAALCAFAGRAKGEPLPLTFDNGQPFVA